jgi:hypothetical protein
MSGKDKTYSLVFLDLFTAVRAWIREHSMKGAVACRLASVDEYAKCEVLAFAVIPAKAGIQ